MTTLRDAGIHALPETVASVDRPALDRLFGRSGRWRICLVIAAAGWGKTTAVESWTRRHRSCWVRCDELEPDPYRFLGSIVRALEPVLGSAVPVPGTGHPIGTPGRGETAVSAAVRVCGLLAGALPDDVVLVIDDIQAAPPGSDVALVVAAVARSVPDKLRLVLVSRRDMPFSVARLQGRGLVAEINAPDLAFTHDDIEALLSASIGVSPPQLTERIWERTAGWPAAVSGAVELLRHGVPAADRPAVVDQLSLPGERFHGYLLEEVLDDLPVVVRDLLRRLAVSGEAWPAAVGPAGVDEAARVLAELTRLGLVRRSSADRDLRSLMPPLADYFEHDPTMTSVDRLHLRLTLAQDSIAAKAFAEALRHLLAGGAHAAAAALVAEHGATLTGSGRADVVLETACLPARYLVDPRVQRVLGHALQVRGRWAEAMECFRRAGQDGGLGPALAWRIGALAFARGELGEVLAVCRRLDDRPAGGMPVDAAEEVRVRTLAAVALRMTGDLPAAREELARAEAAVQQPAAGEDAEQVARARTCVHEVRAMLAVAEGDRRGADVHWSAALQAAETSGDLLRTAWIRSCRAEHLVDVGAPRQAMVDAEAATAVATDCRSPFLVAHAATARARACTRLGRLDEAKESFDVAVEILQGLGSRLLARPLCGLGDLHRARCRLTRARAAYEEALALAEPVQDALGIGAALIGLARVRAADDLDVAWSLAERACGPAADGQLEVGAVLTRGWIALMRGDRAAAARDAVRADAAARLRRDDAGVAEAMVLTALLGADPGTRSARLADAIEIYGETGCLLDEAATRMVAARMAAGGPHRAGGAAAEETLRAAGVDVASGWAAGPLTAPAMCTPTLSIRALGSFQVFRDGVAVPRTAWQSRKARDLVKILVARRRPVPREQLIELLWPDADPVKAANRLSVLLSMVRDVLTPTPDAGDPVATDGGAIGLNLDLVRVDVEEFLVDADTALAAHRAGEPDALARLAAAASSYGGDFLEDDPYPDWAPPLAEELRAIHIALLQALAATRRAAGDVDGTVRCTLRLLGQDPFDEMAHLTLVGVLAGAGRLGESLRHYQHYVQRMVEIGVDPGPMPMPGRTARSPRSALPWAGDHRRSIPPTRPRRS